MKHMLNLLALLSLSFAVQAAPGGPSIAQVEGEGETGAADVKASASTFKSMDPAPIEQMIVNEVVKPKKRQVMKLIIDYADKGFDYAEQVSKNAGKSGAHMSFGFVTARDAMEKIEKAEGAPTNILKAMKEYAGEARLLWRQLLMMAERLNKQLQPPPLPPLPAKKPTTPPSALKPITHVNVKQLRGLGAIIKMIEAVKDTEVLARVIKFLIASQEDLATQVENPRHHNFKAMDQIGGLMKAAKADEKAIYDAIIEHLQSYGVGKAAEKLESAKAIFEIAQEALEKLHTTPY